MGEQMREGSPPETESIPNRDRHGTTSMCPLPILPNMTLNPHPIYPSAGRYVLRLHRDAQPQAGMLAGRIEHVSSGDSVDFASAEQLLDWLARHAAQHHSKEGE